MAEFELYCFGESGNAYKVALMLNLSGLEWDARFVDFFNGETKSEAFRSSVNEMGEVPVLFHQGRYLSQSGVILEYLAQQSGAFGARDPEHGLEILRWILFDNHKLTSYIATLRFLLMFAHSGETEVTAFLRARAKAAVEVLDAHLAGSSGFVTGEQPTIADMSLCGYLFYDGELGFDLDAYANVCAWLARIKSLEGWQHPYELMPRGAPIAT